MSKDLITKCSKSILTLLFVGLCLNSEIVVAQSEKSGVKEIWQEIYLFHDFNEKFYSELLFNNLYNVTAGSSYDWFLEGKLKYHWQPWLDVEAMYRHEYYKIGTDWVQEYRPMIRFSGKTELGNWSIRNRHRFELRMFEIGKTRFRYRTDVKVKPNRDWTCINLSPYIQEELFFGKKGFSRNRLYGGVEGKAGRFEPAFYMLIQSDNIFSNWRNRFIVGFILGIEL